MQMQGQVSYSSVKHFYLVQLVTKTQHYSSSAENGQWIELQFEHGYFVINQLLIANPTPIRFYSRSGHMILVSEVPMPKQFPTSYNTDVNFTKNRPQNGGASTSPRLAKSSHVKRLAVPALHSMHRTPILAK